MKKIILFLFTLFCVVCAKAQSDSSKVPQGVAQPPERVYDEKLPEYPGGSVAMQKFIAENVVYPKKAIKEKIQGTVKVNFVVEKDGSLSNIRTVNKELGGGLEEEAIRVVSLFPNFTPGTQDGNPVKVSMTVPIRFRLK